MRQSGANNGKKDSFLTHGVRMSSFKEERTLIVTVSPVEGVSAFHPSFVVDWQMSTADTREFNDPAKAEARFNLFYH